MVFLLLLNIVEYYSYAWLIFCFQPITSGQLLGVYFKEYIWMFRFLPLALFSDPLMGEKQRCIIWWQKTR